MSQAPGQGLYIHIPFCHQRCHFCAFYLEIHHARAAEEFVASLLTELPQRTSILCVGLDVPTKEYSWSAELLVQQKHEPVLKAKASLPWQHSIGTGCFVGPDEFVVRRGQRQEPNRHARGRRATIRWLRSL
mgnify:CR=1 FL=1